MMNINVTYKRFREYVLHSLKLCIINKKVLTNEFFDFGTHGVKVP